MELKKIILVSLSALAAVRCSDLEYANRTEKTKLVSLAENEKFEVKLRGLDQPNKFKALIEYTGPNPRNWKVIRKSDSAKLTSFEVNTSRGGSLEDEDLQAGSTYTYMIGKQEDGEFLKAREETISVPEDFVVSGVVDLKEEHARSLGKVFRIFFEKDSALKTNGKDVTLEAEEIFSRGGKFQTFSASDVAPMGYNGAPSGKLNLKVGRISGPFTIEIRGQKGGRGFRGATGPQGLQGPPSPKNIVDIGFEIVSHFPEGCSKAYYSPDNRVCPGLSYEECRWRYHPGVGGKGGTGGVGFPGNPGFKGGDVEDAFLEIPPLSEEFKVIYEPGARGQGGEHGDGGPGGPGGPGAPTKNNSPGRPCEGSPDGRPGDHGPNGPEGPDGIPGNKGRLFINGVEQ